MKKETMMGSTEEPIKICTDYDYPVEDESMALESNIEKIGTQVGRENSGDMDRTVRLLKTIHERGRKK
jgi:hypothetical protein